MKQSSLFFYLVIGLLILHINVEGQGTGIKFEADLSWQQILAKARLENKTIFMDCYATWCGPCKSMDQRIYPQIEVGNYFNSNFINVRVQMDKTHKDSDFIRTWYEDASAIADKLKVHEYPTFLFFSAEGQPLNKLVGALNEKELVCKAKGSLLEENQYYTLLNRWRLNQGDSAFLLETVKACLAAGDEPNANKVVSCYLPILKNSFVEDNVGLVSHLVNSESDFGFKWFLDNAAKIDQVEDGRAISEQILSSIIFKDELSRFFLNKDSSVHLPELTKNTQEKYPTLNKNNFAECLREYYSSTVAQEINNSTAGRIMDTKEWDELSKRMRTRFIGFDSDQELLNAEIWYYFAKHSWELCGKSAIVLVDKYSARLGDVHINDIIWKYVFMHSFNRKTLKKATNFMRNVVSNSGQNTAHLDTYANLLYKSGYKDKAIAWESRAVSIANKQGNQQETIELSNTLKKMRNGQITWE